jgi:AraC family transcriptional regulator, ethanolamine operon transcriptional activator
MSLQTGYQTPQFSAMPPPSWHACVRSSDVDVHASAQPQWSLNYDQLSPGRFDGQIELVQLPGLRMIREAANCKVRQRGQIGRGHYGLAMVLEQDSEAIFNGQRLSTESIMIGRGEELDLLTPAHSELIGVVVEHELLAALWQSMYQKPLSAWIEEQIVVQASTASARHLNKMHRRILDLLSSSPELLNDPVALIQLRDAILIEWIEAIPSQVDTSELRRVEARKKVVDRACECMLAHSDQPLSTLDVCSRIGTSPRKLDYCFNDVLGISPKRYLRLVRLNGVRRDLKSRAHEARVKVQDVAARWGFWHLSEFSRDYSAQFGELPSQTLRNAQG